MSKRALITGASSGIGETFARQLAAQGHHLVLVARRKAQLEALAEELTQAHGVEVEVLPADLCVAAERNQVEQRLAGTPGIDVLINNAGFGSTGPFHTLDVETEARMVQLNCIVPQRLCHAALNAWTDRRQGTIVNVSSLASFQPGPEMASYCASKAFLTSFTEALHEEAKPMGIRVFALCPGFTHTGFQEVASTPGSWMPEMAWSSSEDVVASALAQLDGNKAIVIPGLSNWTSAQLAMWSPKWLSRKMSGMVTRRLKD